jgi:hypothetical protein
LSSTGGLCAARNAGKLGTDAAPATAEDGVRGEIPGGGANMLWSEGAAAAVGRPLARRMDSTMADMSVRAIVAKAVAGNLLLLDCFSASSCVRDLRRRGASLGGASGEIDVDRADDVVVVVVVESLVSVVSSVCRDDLLPFLWRRRLLESVDEIDSLTEFFNLLMIRI